MIYVIRSAEHCHLAGYDRLSEAGIEKRHFSFLSPRFVTFRFDSLGLMLGASSLRPRQRQNQKPRRGAARKASVQVKIFAKRYGFIKAWRAKIFAKIEWKDTSKNPTGSKNNSLGMIAREDTNHTLSKIPILEYLFWGGCARRVSSSQSVVLLMK